MIYGDNGTAGFPDLAAIMQSSNLYAYCMNNPVNFIDPWGGVAGEIFYSQEELVKDWAWNYYGVIDYTMFEQASAIYTGKDSSGRIFYSYTEAVVGYPHSVDAAATELMIPKGFSFYAVIHGHPRGAGLSEADMNYATNNYKPIFVVYYNAEYGGTDIKKYTDTRRNGFTAEHIVTSAPYKKLYPDSKKYYEALFKESWKQHTQIPCSFGYDCATIDWPRNR